MHFVSPRGAIRRSSSARTLVVMSLLALPTGCAALVASLRPPPPEPVTVTYRMPTIMPAQGAAQQASVKGGVAITATPATYVEDAGTTSDEIETGRGISCTRARTGGVEVTPVRFLRRTTRPTFDVTPSHLVFLVKITNQMPRVFRGAGTIVQFNVAGNLVSVDRSQYSELSNLMLPPRNEAELHLVGPLLSSIPEGSTIGLFLYDVVTNTDAAGNVTKKQNFEWYYTYRSDVVSRQGVVETSRREEPIGSPTTKPSCQ
jgi:hypothetical protein